MGDLRTVPQESFSGEQVGAYLLLNSLGQGEQSWAYLAEHMTQRTQAALKIWGVHLSLKDRESFLTRVNLLTDLRHPGLVPTWEHSIHASLPFLVMAYAPHGTLRQRHPRGTHVAPTLLLPYVQQMSVAFKRPQPSIFTRVLGDVWFCK